MKENFYEAEFETTLGGGMLRQALVGIRISGYFSGYFLELSGSIRGPAG